MKTTKRYRENIALDKQYDSLRHSDDNSIRWYLYIEKWNKLLVLAMLLGAAFGAWSLMRFNPTYHTHLLASSKYLTNEQVNSFINSVHLQLSDGDYELVADKLSMSAQQAAVIKSIQCDYRSKNNTKKVFKLKIQTSSNENHAFYEQKLFDYLENLTYVKNKVRAENELTRNKLLSVRKTYDKIDRMEVLLNKNMLSRGKKKLDAEDKRSMNESLLSIAAIANQKLQLQEQLFEMEKELTSNDNFEIIQGFEEYNKPTEKSIFSAFLAPMLTALLLWLGVTWLLELKEELKRRTRLVIK